MPGAAPIAVAERNRLRRETGKGSIIIVAGIAAGSLAMGVLAKLLTVEQFGVYIVATTLLNYAVVVARSGVESAIVRFMHEYEDPSIVRAFLRWVDRTTVTTSLAVAAVLGILVLVTRGRTEALTWSLALAAASGLLPLSAIYVSTAILRAQRRVMWSLLPLRVLRPIIGLAVALLFFFVFDARTGLAATYAEVLGLVGLAALLGVMTRDARVGEAADVDPGVRQAWSAATSRMTVGEVAQQIVGQVDVVLVGAMFGVSSAGVYGFASRLARLVLLGNKAANSVAGPMIAQAYNRRDIATMQSVVSHTCLVAAAGTVVASAGLLLLPTAAFHWLGEGFVAARPILSLLLAAQIVNAVTGPVGLVLVLTGHERAQAVVNVVSGVVLLGGIAIIAAAGGDVRAVAVLLALVIAVSNIVKVGVVYRRTGVVAMPFVGHASASIDITPRNRRWYRLWLSLASIDSSRSHIFVARGSNLSARHVRIGAGTRINGPCVAKGRGELNIAPYCAIGYDVKFITSNHAMGGVNLNVALQHRLGLGGGIDESRMGITIGANAWIGDNAILLPGITIGVGAIVGAGAVVTRSVPDFGICVGNPGRVIRRRFPDAVCDALVASRWWERDEATLRRHADVFAAADVASSADGLQASLERLRTDH